MSFGIDLSHHQDPKKLPWNRFEGVVDFVICRAGYGGALRDRHVVEHIRQARVIGAKVGLYLFFRPSQSVDSHWALLRSVADEVNLDAGDIVPTIDVEHDPFPKPGTNVSPAWSAPCEALVQLAVEAFGDAMVYITQREDVMLGKPTWLRQRPIWVAHYTTKPQPAVPVGTEPTIWQYRVGPFDPKGPGGYDQAHPQLDHNRGLKPLPLIGGNTDAELDELRDQSALLQFETELITA